MRLVFAGTPAAALPSLDALAGSAHQLLAVLTRPPAAAGRGRRPRRSPVHERAVALGLPVLTPARPADPQFLAEAGRLTPDCCPVVGYGALLPEPALRIPRHGWVNLHFSVLPAWRGAAPVAHAILRGDDLTGATTFRLVAELDAGPWYGTLTTPIGPRETAGELTDRLAREGASLLLATLDAIATGTADPRPQPAEGVSYAPRIRPADARVDWSTGAMAVDRLLRACTPDPGGWTTFRGARVNLGPVTPCGPVALRPGEIGGDGRVGTGQGGVALGSVQPAGRRPMPAADWLRGARLTGGDRFE